MRSSKDYEEQGPRKISEFEIDLRVLAEDNLLLLLRKHKDYGPNNIALAPGGPINGLRVRMHDKLSRINHLYDTGATPENEPLRDSFIDMANYALIALMVLDGKWHSDVSNER
jgi:hypothetical protein